MTDHPDPALFEIFAAVTSEWDEALVANDAERIAAYAAEEWTFLGPDGPFPGADFLAATARGEVSHDTMTSEVHKVFDLGDVAVVVSRVQNTGRYRGEPFENDEWTSDVFVKRDDRWQCVLTHLTPARASDSAGREQPPGGG
ncbi:DUF4440 domain-containing protein [Gordonia iterans]|uniref:DUF4440 domain-containing protein n=1 Tax=Gordonia iterans TaxID=1004901 RepID=A0A2S0KFD0_9ACTN|nr:nuclear transport factor 2 family protein [Gordonia iterans]AVM00374.1 DUF4440 domain-containing protein [Gordonia iterans]